MKVSYVRYLSWFNALHGNLEAELRLSIYNVAFMTSIQNVFYLRAFFIAFVTYALTVEPTVSFWDAVEYILTASKLQVGHPPGAPLFQMMGAFFSIFATDPTNIGLVLNMMSGAASAFTILFMF